MEIQLYSKIQDPITAIERLGTIITRSGLGGCSKSEEGQVLAWEAMTQHKSPVQLLREFHIIEGKLADRADSLLAKFLERGGKHKIIARTQDAASVELTTKDGQSFISTLTWSDVQHEPFVKRSDGKGFKKNWATPRARMQTLWARVISDGVRALDPRIACGIGIVEEIEDGGTTQTGPALVLAPTADSPEETQPTAKVIDVTATVDTTSPPADEPELAKQGLAPELPEAGALPASLVEQLEQAIGVDAIAAVNWMRKNNWLKPGQDLSHVKEVHAKRVLHAYRVANGDRNSNTFIRAITEAK